MIVGRGDCPQSPADGSQNRLVFAHEDVRPLVALSDEPGTNRILQNVVVLLGFALIVTQSVIEEISLPLNSDLARRDSLEITNQFGKARIAWNGYEHV